MSRRSHFGWAIAAAGLSSVGNLGLTVAAARGNSVEEFGRFAVAMLAFTLTTGGLRAAVVEPVLASKERRTSDRTAVWTSMLWGALIGLIVFGVGLVLGWQAVVIVGLSLPGLVLFDATRTLLVARRRGRAGAIMETVWTATTLAAAIPAALGMLSVSVALTMWGSAATVVGGSATYLSVGPLRAKNSGRSFQPLYALDYAAGVGSTPLAMSVLAASSSAAIVGSLRAAGTLFGPLNIVASAVRPVLIARFGEGDEGSIRAKLLLACSFVGIMTPVAAVLVLLPDQVGQALLGASWEPSQKVLLPMALEALLGLFSGVAFAAHRAHGVAVRILVTRCSLAGLRIIALVVAGATGGLVGAGWAIPAVSCVGAVVWWTGLRQVERRRVQG